MLVQLDYPRTCDCDSLMNNFLATDRVPDFTQFPSLDVIEQENEIVVSAELPGMKKEDVKITFEKNVLTISGERKPAGLSEKAKVLLKETQSDKFDRSIRLGYEIDSSKISAEMSNGVLTITLPKAESVKAKEISIN